MIAFDALTQVTADRRRLKMSRQTTTIMMNIRIRRTATLDRYYQDVRPRWLSRYAAVCSITTYGDISILWGFSNRPGAWMLEDNPAKSIFTQNDVDSCKQLTGLRQGTNVELYEKSQKSAQRARTRDVFEDNMDEAKARSYWIKATYAYAILHE